MWESVKLAVSAAIAQAPNVIPGDEMESSFGGAISRDKEVFRVVFITKRNGNIRSSVRETVVEGRDVSGG